MFSNQKLSLKRLEQICQLLGFTFSELIKKMEVDQSRIEMLSIEQEAAIASNLKLLLVTVCVLHYWSFEDILLIYQFTKSECIKLLAQLDHLKVIELLPLNRVRLIVAKNFRWQPNGPIQKFFQEKIQQDFFRSSFTAKGEKLLFKSGMLSQHSYETIMKKMDKLIAEFYDLHDQDSSLTLEERFGTSIVVALRAWEFCLFSQFRRNPNLKQL